MLPPLKPRISWMTKKPIQPRTKALASAQITVPAAQPAPTETPISTVPKPQTKAALLREMLEAPAGATVPAIMATTGWQDHTVRAALSGLRKSGCVLNRRSGTEGTIYAIVQAAQPGLPVGGGKPSGASVAPHCLQRATSDGDGDGDGNIASSSDASDKVATALCAPVGTAVASTNAMEKPEPRS